VHPEGGPVAALVDLIRLYLPGMLDRDRGAVINVASTAAFQPVPYMAVYGLPRTTLLLYWYSSTPPILP
jgi:uncharacterized protein